MISFDKQMLLGVFLPFVLIFYFKEDRFILKGLFINFMYRAGEVAQLLTLAALSEVLGSILRTHEMAHNAL